MRRASEIEAFGSGGWAERKSTGVGSDREQREVGERNEGDPRGKTLANEHPSFIASSKSGNDDAMHGKTSRHIYDGGRRNCKGILTQNTYNRRARKCRRGERLCEREREGAWCRGNEYDNMRCGLGLVVEVRAFERCERS